MCPTPTRETTSVERMTPIHAVLRAKMDSELAAKCSSERRMRDFVEKHFHSMLICSYIKSSRSPSNALFANSQLTRKGQCLLRLHR